MSEDVAIFTTGGTTDKVYFDALSAYQVGESIAGEILRAAQVAQNVRIVELMRKDSLEMTDADRARICEAVAHAPERRIIVTHGTDTIVETAQHIDPHRGDRTVVLVGALTPARFAESDAAFNLGLATAAVQLAQPGVYVAMNGTIFPAATVRKDRATMRFVGA